jgi:hypothetical protein
MAVELKPTSVILARLGLNPDGEVQKFFTSECAKAMDKYVPMRNGNLRDYIIEGNYIIYEQPYARYQYYGVREDGTHKVQHYTTPGTGPYWDRVMWTAKGPDIVKRVQQKLGGK